MIEMDLAGVRVELPTNQPIVLLKERAGERKLWLRLIGSTMVGELADTVVFCTIAFYGVITGAEFLNYVVVGYFYKTAIEALFLPITYQVVAAVKRREPSYADTVLVPA